MFSNNSAAKETRADPFKMEDPFKSDLFKGVNTSSSLLIYSFFRNDCGCQLLLAFSLYPF